MHIHAARAGLRVTEVPTVEHARVVEKSRLVTVRDGLHVLSVIVRERLRRQRSDLAGR